MIMRGAEEKILSRDDLVPLVERLRAQGRRVGYTSGTFDIVHPGHVLYLQRAKEACDVLIVGVNSDASVRQYKGRLRPVLPQAARACVVAGLEAVDYVFLFDEVNNNTNVQVLKPDLYIKAADYDRSSLSSAGLVEAHGGKVMLVPMEAGYSTSSIIDHVMAMQAALDAGSLELPPREKAPAVFIDRDGTVNEHVDYLHEPEKFRLLPGVIEALKKLRDAGFRLVIITNQPGIGLGYFSKEDFYRVNLELLRAAGRGGVLIDKVYFCPHSKADECCCRKPQIGLPQRAVKELNIDLQKSYVVGDMSIDLMLGKNLGCPAVLVGTGYAGKDGIYDIKADYSARDLMDAAQWILNSSGRGVKADE
jgi:D-glycero-D-manno-heptose 1,7-bisphosphate phosphatase